MPYKQAQAHFEQGRHAPAGDPQRRAYLERAGAIYTRLGAAHDARRSEEELSR
jgi:hypothetical protein